MSQKKKKDASEAARTAIKPPKAETPPPVEDLEPIDEPEQEAPPEEPATERDEPKPVYSFPSRPLCPRCHTTNNVRTSQKADVQYRRCRQPICNHRFSVRGKAVQPAESEIVD